MTGEAQPDGSGVADDEGRREIEWQLSAPDLGLVRTWLSDHDSVDGLTIEALPGQTILDTYLDTDDWRIRRAGFALRLRDSPGRIEATLKDLAPASDGVRVRREFSEPLARADFEALAVGSGPVSSRVHDVTGPAPLKALFRVRTRRECFAAVAQGGQPAAEIALDDTVIAAADGDPSEHLRRVEVEALSEAPQLLVDLVDQLRSECDLTTATDSKYDVGLKVAGFGPPASPELGSLTIEPAMSAGEVARVNLRRQLAIWFLHEPAARLGEDPEALHVLRVSARRIETTLGIFEPYLPRTLVRQRPAWKSLVRTLGTVRDFDVQLDGLAAFASDLQGRDAAPLASLRERLEAERRVARSRMLSMLDRSSTRRLVHGMLAALARPVTARVTADNPVAATVAPRLIRRAYRKLRKTARTARADGTAAAHHALRGRAKRLRYTIESFDGFYGDDARRMLKAVRRLQSCLGSNQDAHVAAGRFKEMVDSRSHKLPSATVFWMGVLSERHRTIAADVGPRLERRYAKLRGRRWKSLRRTMAELANTQATGPKPPAAPPTGSARS
jgi:triphosphatase